MYDPRFDELPANVVDYPKRLARDLSIGYYNQDWENWFPIRGMHGWGYSLNKSMVTNEKLLKYFDTVWGENIPWQILIDKHYLLKNQSFGDDTSYYSLTSFGLAFAEEVQTHSIFISYRRCESSALALLILSRMAARKATAYLDQHPDPEFPNNRIGLGKDWEPELRRAVLGAQVIVFLIGPKTLDVDSFAHKELLWALNATPPKTIIPFLHNGFKREHLINFEVHTDPRLIALIKDKQGVSVNTEDPDGYNTAIERLLIEMNIRE